jgi:hypothetical protein
MTYSKGTTASATFILCCLVSSARLLVDAPSASRLKNFPDKVGQRSDQRFAALKAVLPERGVVGYIGEPGAPALGDYYLTQYALAPLVVDHSANHSLVIGNFSNSIPSEPPPHLHLKKSFGEGVFLFATEATTQRTTSR